VLVDTIKSFSKRSIPMKKNIARNMVLIVLISIAIAFIAGAVDRPASSDEKTRVLETQAIENISKLMDQVAEIENSKPESDKAISESSRRERSAKAIAKIIAVLKQRLQESSNPPIKIGGNNNPQRVCLDLFLKMSINNEDVQLLIDNVSVNSPISTAFSRNLLQEYPYANTLSCLPFSRAIIRNLISVDPSKISEKEIEITANVIKNQFGSAESDTEIMFTTLEIERKYATGSYHPENIDRLIAQLKKITGWTGPKEIPAASVQSSEKKSEK
jgi:hypothetical protein